MILVVSFAVLGAAAAATIFFTTGMLVFWYDLWKLILMMAGCFAAVNIVYFLLALLLTVFVDAKEDVDHPRPFFVWNIQQVAELLCIYCNVRTHVSGEEKIPVDSRFLLISNHRSNFDPIVVMDKLRKYSIAFISKASNLKIPIVGTYVRQCCFLPIDRDNPRNAMKSVLKAVDYIKRGVTSFGIYPEGTRSKGEKMLPFRAGSLKIAQKADVPIVVSTVRGTEKIAKNFPAPTDVYIDILAVISAEEVRACKTVDMTEQVREMMAEHLLLLGDKVNG